MNVAAGSSRNKSFEYHQQKINNGNFGERNDIRLQFPGTWLYNASFRIIINAVRSMLQSLKYVER